MIESRTLRAVMTKVVKVLRQRPNLNGGELEKETGLSRPELLIALEIMYQKDLIWLSIGPEFEKNHPWPWTRIMAQTELFGSMTDEMAVDFVLKGRF